MGYSENLGKSNKRVKAGGQVTKNCPECGNNWIGHTHSKCPSCGCSKSGFEVTISVEERNRLVESCLKLARATANIVCKKKEYLDDCYSVAYMALIEAAERFDPNRGAYTTYATYWIRKKVYEYLNEENPVAFGSKENNDIGKARFVDIDGAFKTKDGDDSDGYYFYPELMKDDAKYDLAMSRETLKKYTSELPQRHRKFIEVYLSSGCNYVDAGLKLNVTKLAVEWTISRSIELIQHLIKEGKV